MFQQWIPASLILMLLFLTGCARTLTSKETFLSADFTITLRSTPQINTRYYIILSSSTPTTPLPTSLDYFPTPGSTFDENNVSLQAKPLKLQSYYQSFFSTWQDYIVIDIDGNGTPIAKLFSSNSQKFSSTTTTSNQYSESIGFSPLTLSVSGPTLRIRFSLKDMPWAKSALYFQVATARLSDGTQSGTIQDIIDTGTLILPIINQAQIDNTSDPDDTTLDIHSSADILNWSLKIW